MAASVIYNCKKVEKLQLIPVFRYTVYTTEKLNVAADRPNMEFR